MDSVSLVAMFDYIDRNDLGIHSVLVVRNGYLVLEAYFYPWHQNRRHDIYSCTKSFTSALVGIAVDEGHLSLDQKVLDFFPGREVVNDDARKRAMTVAHLLTMRSGLDWPESSVSYSSSDNILGQMFRSDDWVQFVLDRPMVAQPGAVFNYNSGASHLLAAIFEQATGESMWVFAVKRLFGPLGISRVHWSFDPDGVTFGAGGLHMLPRDMTKFGYLYLQGGVWEGEQIVPADWVEASTSASGYGYQWWMLKNGGYAAFGYKGQRIVVVPDRDLVVVVTGDFPAATAQFLIDAYVVPAARSAEPLPENASALAALESWISEAASPKQ